jgi:hypothetical protein
VRNLRCRCSIDPFGGDAVGPVSREVFVIAGSYPGDAVSTAKSQSPRVARKKSPPLGGFRSHVQPPVFGDAAGWAAVAAGLAGLVERGVEGARAEPAAAALDQAVGVVRAGPSRSGGAVTVFVGRHRAALALVPSPALACLIRNDSPSVITVWQWCSSRSSRLTAVVCSGRKRPQDSKGQCEPMPRERRS